MSTAKPLLVAVGRHLVDPSDVAGIIEVPPRAGRDKALYIVRLKSQPNAEFPLWAEEQELQVLLQHFRIVS